MKPVQSDIDQELGLLRYQVQQFRRFQAAMIDRESIDSLVEVFKEGMHSRAYELATAGSLPLPEVYDIINEALAVGVESVFIAEENGRAPIDMVLHCPNCGMQHVDKPDPERGWMNPPHKSHLCLQCNAIWRVAPVPTNGVPSLPRGEFDNWPADPNSPNPPGFLRRMR